MAAEAVGGAFLSSFLGVLFDRLSSPEVLNLIRGKKLDQKLVGRLETTVCAARAVLNDAEQKQIKDQEVNKWLSNLKDAVYEADDILDEVSTVAEIQKLAPGNSSKSPYLNLHDREIVDRMEDIIDKLESIVKLKDTLGLKEIPKESMSWRITTSLVETSDIYGRDKDKEAIIKLLLEDTSDGEISVIPIVGLGGIGKTTLAQLVYNDDKVKHKFDVQAWVCVGDEFDIIKVTRTIIEAITHDSCHINDLNSLQHDLKEKFSRLKFFVVLDDAWNENYDEWNMLLKPFQNKVKGSKILITTRSKKVASPVQTVPPHELSLLSPDDCWLVFAKHALLSTESTKNANLEKIGREIVCKCNGLPLAAQTLGGLLRGNSDVRYWNHILKSEIWEFAEDSSKIISALRLSYYYLPSYLKECFVYCSLYPKDYQFDKEELILLWMAQDLLQIPKRRKTLEEIGHEYFDELVARSFFQPSSTNANVYVMHDLMHDLATFYAGEFYFRAEELESATEIGIETRHLSYNVKGNYPISNLLAVSDRVKHTRTFLEINWRQWHPLNIENSAFILLSQLKYLRVLSLEYFPLDHGTLPDLIGDLIHLRYLNLSRTSIVTLPKSLGNLYNLQTLKLRFCSKLKMLPNDMHHLVNLRYLDIRGTNIEEMPKWMNKLKDLQLLSHYIIGKQEDNGIKELGALTTLHGSLIVTKLENVIKSGETSKARMDDKKHISILELRWSRSWLSHDNIVDSQFERDILDNLQPHRDLKVLSITGYRGTVFPNWLGHSSYHNMSKITLSECRNCCMLPPLGQLPYLKHLRILWFYRLEIIDTEFYKNDESCLGTPFPSLETLEFHCLSHWREWRSFELGAFPQLKRLEIQQCPVLKGDLPNHLPTLEKLVIEGCQQFACSLPSAPAILQLHIIGKNKMTVQELPHSVAILLQLKSLQRLQFWGCDSLTSLQLDAFPNVTELEIWKCENMKSLDVVSQSRDTAALPSLRNLLIVNCPRFVSCPTLAMAAPLLESLSISGCQEIDLFTERGLPPNLRKLAISGSEKLTRCLARMDLNTLPLTHLWFGGPCEDVKLFPKESCMPTSLEYMELKDLESLEILECNGLVHLTSLQGLKIEDCPKLENIAGERLPASLIQLDILDCPLLAKHYQERDLQIWPKISHILDISVKRKSTW